MEVLNVAFKIQKNRTRHYIVLITSMLYSKYQEYYYFLLKSNIKTHYLCFQKVEEEIGSAGEQPISNNLFALYSKLEGAGILLSFFLLSTGSLLSICSFCVVGTSARLITML